MEKNYQTERNLKITAGRVYSCPICGAEVTVTLFGDGKLAPVCCNQPMEITDIICSVYSCPACGAEITVIKEGEGALTPQCCNRHMTRLVA